MPDRLAAHHIHEIRAATVSSRYPRVIGRNARREVHGSGPTTSVTIITTNRGAVGWGISRANERDAHRLIGRRLDELFDPAIGVIAPEAMLFDFPLHDLAGVILDQPVWEILGGHGEPATLCYDGAIYIDDILPEERPRGLGVILENCEHDYALGYRAFKLKIGRGYKWMDSEAGLARDIEVTHLVRERYSDCDILVDANDGYTCDQFLRYLGAVADCDLYWIEEPFRENRRDLLRLKESLAKCSPNTLIADGESHPEVPQLLELAREGLLDVLIMDIVGLGFTPWRQTMPDLMAVSVLSSPHTWGDPLKTRYAAQLAAGLGNVLTVEGVPGESEDVDWSAYALRDGSLYVPGDPGFGMKLLAG